MDIYEYTGEYGIEISTFIPFIHYLKSTGQFQGKKVLTYDGMQPYYFFLDPSEVLVKTRVPRVWLPPAARPSWLPIELRDEDKLYEERSTPPPKFLVPDYMKYYSQFNLQGSGKPLFIIQNKYTMEWGGVPISYVRKETLAKCLSHLCHHFQVIYIRSNDLAHLPGYSHDHNEAYNFDLEEKQMLRKEFQDVVLIEDLVEQFKDVYSFNMLKSILLSNAAYVLTTLGGATFFSLAFPCKHIVHRCDKPDKKWPIEVYRPPYNLDPCVTTPTRYTQKWFQNVHDIMCPHPHGQLTLTNAHEELETLLLSLSKTEN